MLLVAAMALTLGTSLSPVTLTPRCGAQRTALVSLEREICYSGRKNGGKSWLACVKAYAYADRYPGARVLLCREERASMDDTTLPVLWKIVPPDVKAACWKKADSRLALPNGSEVQVDGLDRPSRIQGSRYGFAACDQAEDLNEEQFEILNGSIGQAEMPFRQLMLLFNPSHTEHWAYKRYSPDMGDGVREVPGGNKARVIHVQPDDLMDLITDDYRRTLDGYSGVLRKRLRLGLWCNAEGQVFELWDPAVHVVDRATIDRRYPADPWSAWAGFPPPHWPRWFGIDFGYEPDPFACGWWAQAPEGTRYLYRQLCHLRRTIDEQAAQILALEAEELAALRECCPASRAQELRPYLARLNVCRWSDHHRGERAMLAQRGIATSPADKDVLASIQTLQPLMKLPNEEEAKRSGRYWPILQIVKGSLAELDPLLRERRQPTCLEEEMGGYIWRTAREGSAGGGLSRQLPRQINDHCIDGMLRYVHHSLARGRAGVWV